MDVARSFSHWRGQPPEEWLRAVNRYAPPAITAALVVLIAYQLAELTWVLAPHDTFDRAPPRIVQPAPAAGGPEAADYSMLADSRLFGDAPEAAPPVLPAELADAPDTTLSLRLTGVIAGGGDLGQAIIAGGRGQEKKYAVGQTIEGTNAVRLHAVFHDRVILDRGGQLETLRLPKDAPPSRAASVRPSPAPVAAAEEPLRNVISSNASRLTNVMRMAPHMEGGAMVGFRVNPGRDRETFEALGLIPGDIVTDINGIVLDDPARALQVFEALGETTQANVTVLRDGVPTVMVIDTSQLQSLAEDRQ